MHKSSLHCRPHQSCSVCLANANKEWGQKQVCTLPTERIVERISQTLGTCNGGSAQVTLASDSECHCHCVGSATRSKLCLHVKVRQWLGLNSVPPQCLFEVHAHYAAASWGCSIFLHSDPMACTHGTCGMRLAGLRPAQSPPAPARRVSVGVICGGGVCGGAPPKTFCAVRWVGARVFQFGSQIRTSLVERNPMVQSMPQSDTGP